MCGTRAAAHLSSAENSFRNYHYMKKSAGRQTFSAGCQPYSINGDEFGGEKPQAHIWGGVTAALLRQRASLWIAAQLEQRAIRTLPARTTRRLCRTHCQQ